MANRVQPLRDPKKIQEIEELILAEEMWRDYALFVCGINFGLRIGDLLRVRLSDLTDSSGRIRESFEIVEQKTQKRNFIPINDKAHLAITRLMENTPISRDVASDDHIIYNTRNPFKPIGRVQSYKIIRKWTERVGITETAIGTHTLRKTWGYHAFKNNIPIEVIQAKFMHKSVETTRHYLGIERKDVNEAYNRLNL